MSNTAHTNHPTTATVYVAGGCLWGVEEFMRHLPGVLATEAGRANGQSSHTQGPYDGYAECVKLTIDTDRLAVAGLMAYLFEIIDPYSVNRQGEDVGPKYRTGFYSEDEAHLSAAKAFISARDDASEIALEVLPLVNYVPSDAEHQRRLQRCPDDYCHIAPELLHKYRAQN